MTNFITLFGKVDDCTSNPSKSDLNPGNFIDGRIVLILIAEHKTCFRFAWYWSLRICELEHNFLME